MTDDNTQHAIDDNAFAQEPRLWQNETWTAKVIKNDDDDGWAVAMFKDGESEAELNEMRLRAGLDATISYVEDDYIKNLKAIAGL